MRCSARSALARPIPKEITLRTSPRIAPTLVLDSSKRRVQPHGHVSTTDVETNAGDADLAFVGDDAANWLRIPKVPIGADHAGNDVAHAHAVAHLGDGGFIVLAEYLHRCVLIGGRLRWQHNGSRFRR